MDIEQVILPGFDVMIAGGSVRKAMIGEELGKSDYDVFFKSRSDYTRAIELLASMNVNIRRHPNCVSFTAERKWFPKLSQSIYIQLINKETHKTMEELMNSFDFTVCQFGYKNGDIYYTEDALQHHYERKLEFTERKLKDDTNVALVRVCKYTAAGYAPSEEVFERALVKDQEALRRGDIVFDGYEELYDQF